jgi:Cu2+-exporting ATPase
MSCCDTESVPTAVLSSPEAARPRVDPTFVRAAPDGSAHIDFLVPEMHCAGCLSTIERALLREPGVAAARANLTAHRVAVDFDAARAAPDRILAAIERLGYSARPFDPAVLAPPSDETSRQLVRAMAVAGFAAANIMLLSVSVWSGAEGATRDLFHWISALIAIPTIAYSGRPFFRSAAKALAARRLNMDVPISLGVLLAASMSLYETATHGEHAWFDASVALLFFLLVGRFLDHRMRDVTRSAAAGLLSLSVRSAMRLEDDGSIAHVPIEAIVPGDRVQIAPGDRVPADGIIVDGVSEIDRSMLTGEAEPEVVGVGATIFAGTLNLTGPLQVRVTARSGDSLLAGIVRLMQAAEVSNSAYVRLADRAARLYSPAVHLLAAATFAGWMVAGAGWHTALTACVAVLIITCPCALGLAVPAVQIVSSGALLRRGILLKDGSALERPRRLRQDWHLDRGASTPCRRPAGGGCGRLVDGGSARAPEPPSARAEPRRGRGGARHRARGDCGRSRTTGARHRGGMARPPSTSRPARMGRRRGCRGAHRSLGNLDAARRSRPGRLPLRRCAPPRCGGGRARAEVARRRRHAPLR